MRRWRPMSSGAAATCRDLADDVLQETWMTAVRRVRRFDPGAGPFCAWLCGIAANVLRNQLRAASDDPIGSSRSQRTLAASMVQLVSANGPSTSRMRSRHCPNDPSAVLRNEISGPDERGRDRDRVWRDREGN